MLRRTEPESKTSAPFQPELWSLPLLQPPPARPRASMAPFLRLGGTLYDGRDDEQRWFLLPRGSVNARRLLCESVARWSSDSRSAQQRVPLEEVRSG